MRHRVHGRKFSRPTAHRKAMLANLAQSLIAHESIKTTVAKAKDLRPFVERLITLGKKGDLPARRRALSILNEKSAVAKVMSDLASRFEKRSGGYTRIVKAGNRYGDNAEMAYIQLVDYQVPEDEPEVEGSSEAAPAA